MFFSRISLLLFVLLFSFSCSRTSTPEAVRTAILPLHNLSSDPKLDWLGRAIAGMVVSQNSPDSNLRPIEAATERDAWLAHATQTIEGTFTVTGDRVDVIAHLRVAQKNVKTLRAAAPLADSPAAIAGALARQLSSNVHAFETSSRDAILHFYQAGAGADLNEVLAEATAAAEADPKFGKAQVVRAEALLASGNRTSAQEAAAAASGARLNALDRARLDVISANLSGDSEAREKAIGNLAGLTDDVQLWVSLAERRFVRKDYAAAASILEKALRIEPDNVQLWNQLGYARAYAGQTDAAVKAIREYQRRSPQDLNVLDSLGEIYFVAGNFNEAEKAFLNAFEKENSLFGGGESYRAGICRYLMGDVPSADQHFTNYIEYRKKLKDPLIEVRRAIWLYETGRAEASIQKLQQLATASGTTGSAAATQLSLILAASGRTSEAAKALSGVSSPIASALITAPQPPQAPPNLTGWWLLFHAKYADAVKVWQQVYNATSGLSASEARVALAWALEGAGQAETARPLLAVPPIPAFAPDPGVATLLLPKWQELRARVRK